jgi:hypothetical protein
MMFGHLSEGTAVKSRNAVSITDLRSEFELGYVRNSSGTRYHCSKKHLADTEIKKSDELTE